MDDKITLTLSKRGFFEIVSLMLCAQAWARECTRTMAADSNKQLKDESQHLLSSITLLSTDQELRKTIGDACERLGADEFHKSIELAVNETDAYLEKETEKLNGLSPEIQKALIESIQSGKPADA